jgi:hypothetical protein
MKKTIRDHSRRFDSIAWLHRLQGQSAPRQLLHTCIANS